MGDRVLATEAAARTSLSLLQRLLAEFHPRNFAVRLWDGTTWEPEPGQSACFTLVLRHPGSLRSMFLPGAERGMAEAYLYDDIDIEGVLEDAFPMAEHLFTLRLALTDRLRLLAQLRKLPPSSRPRAGRRPAKLHGKVHSPERDRKAVTYHYDTSNSLFASFLDRRMVYSCAYFHSPDEDLDTAQERKLEYICRKLRLRPGERLLDIGCGWGGLILHAAKTCGVSALGITLSAPQAELANERIRQEGLQDRCRAEVRDYRAVPGEGTFDKLVSVGMVEHVGEIRLPEYFRTAWRLLRPGGAFLNHGIAQRVHAFDEGGPSFSDAYVFPDGDPLPIHVETRIAEEAGFEVRDVENLREHYALTLRHWVRRLEARHDEIVQATDEATYRVWRLFMSGSAYRFDAGVLNVYQSLLVKQDAGKSGMPLTREEWYR